jgi:fatty-acyl-CoA synthase
VAPQQEHIARGLAHWLPDRGVALPQETVGGMLRRHAGRIGDRPALFYLSDPASDALAAITYGELLSLAENCARELAARHAPGERIALWSQNAVESVILQYACALAGTILTPFNTAWTDHEVEHALALTRPAVVFAGKDHAGRDLAGRLSGADGTQVLPLADIARTARETSNQPLPDVAQDDPFLIQFTSGTTGKAKGALLSHRACLLGGWLRPHCEGAGIDDVWLNALPFHHIGGSCAVVLGALGVGGSLVVLERYDRDQLIRLMPIVRATRMGGVPTMWHDILASPILCNTVRLKSVSLGGASVSVALARAIFDRLGARAGIGYGQSEFPIISATLPDDPVEIACETVGKPLPHIELKIIDPATGATLRCDEVGEICLRGPMSMDGYWDNPEATGETITSDGFLHTGDLGSLDAEGYCRISGRLREMIIRGGENVYPVEIENALMAHPHVAMAAVIGVPHARLGQDVGAVIKLHASASADSAELERHVAGLVARFKVPRHWHFVDAMPMTASGKIRKFELEGIFAPT